MTSSADAEQMNKGATDQKAGRSTLAARAKRVIGAPPIRRNSSKEQK
jgi:hypothetical protein